MTFESDEEALVALEALIRRCRRPGQAAHAAYKLHLLIVVMGLAEDPRVAAARRRLLELITVQGWGDIVDRQLTYALRLSDSEGDLLYEEMHKLFSLCDELYALRALGLPVEEASWIRFERAARRRFERQGRMAALVAEDRAEPWKAELWWYSENRR